jgi:hypothetical protein
VSEICPSTTTDDATTAVENDGTTSALAVALTPPTRPGVGIDWARVPINGTFVRILI